MKFPYAMLQDYVQTEMTAEQIGDLLTMAGFELEGIESVEGDAVLDIKVMSNRGDGLSIVGLAREVLAKDAQSTPTKLYQRAVNRFADVKMSGANLAQMRIESEDCRRFASSSFTGVKNSEAPDWIQKRLRQAGMRPISKLVDLTNYVMLELGQPLHAFDLEKLKGATLIARRAKAGETLETLNGVQHTLRDDQLVIADAERAIGIAGVMGGLDTEVSEGTTTVLLESANFLNTSIRRTRKQVGLSTEASYRFERSVDPEGVLGAIRRFAELLEIPGSEITDLYPGYQPRPALSLRIDRATELLGMPIGDKAAQGYLERLGMEVGGHGNPFTVIPPSWRPDLVREIDLIEELGRVHGYERIPELLPEGTTTRGGSLGKFARLDGYREALLRLGLTQTISHSLRDLHPLDASGERIGPRNPSSPDNAYLRNSLLPSLADAAARNGGREFHLFEIGKAFGRDDHGYIETLMAGVLMAGPVVPVARKGEAVPNEDFFSLKGAVLESLAVLVGDAQLQAPEPGHEDARFHPGRQAQIVAKSGQVIGILGQLHPDVAKASGLPAQSLAAEVNLDAALALASNDVQLRAISRNPAAGRDIALLIDKSVPFAKIEATIAEAAGELLERQWLFDVFDGTGIPEGQHSLGIGLQLRKLGENFTDEEANQVRDQIVAALAELGGSTR